MTWYRKLGLVLVLSLVIVSPLGAQAFVCKLCKAVSSQNPPIYYEYCTQGTYAQCQKINCSSACYMDGYGYCHVPWPYCLYI